LCRLAQWADTRVVRSLGVEEHRALFDAPEPGRDFGIRDRAMPLLAPAGREIMG